jgi:hypothetical protein
MSSDADRRRLIERANRLLKQSRTLRKMSEELHQEGKRVRDSVADARPKRARKKR